MTLYNNMINGKLQTTDIKTKDWVEQQVRIFVKHTAKQSISDQRFPDNAVSYYTKLPDTASQMNFFTPLHVLIWDTNTDYIKFIK